MKPFDPDRYILTSDTNLSTVLQTLCAEDEQGLRMFELSGRQTDGKSSRATLYAWSGEVVVMMVLTCTYRAFTLDCWAYWVSDDDVSEVKTYIISMKEHEVVDEMRRNVPKLFSYTREAVANDPGILGSLGMDAATERLISSINKNQNDTVPLDGAAGDMWRSANNSVFVDVSQEAFDRIFAIASEHEHLKDRCNTLRHALHDATSR